MFSQTVRQVMQNECLLTASHDTTVSDACRQMSARNVSAVVVLERGSMVGIFTERDVVTRIVAQGRDPRTTLLHQVMSPQPASIDPGKTFGAALALMQERGFRHLPVVENGLPVGMVTARDALDPDLEDFVCEAERRKGFR